MRPQAAYFAYVAYTAYAGKGHMERTWCRVANHVAQLARGTRALPRSVFREATARRTLASPARTPSPCRVAAAGIGTHGRTWRAVAESAPGLQENGATTIWQAWGPRMFAYA